MVIGESRVGAVDINITRSGGPMRMTDNNDNEALAYSQELSCVATMARNKKQLESKM